jgi:hypothetical protein
MLTDDQRKELEGWGAPTVRAHISGFPFGAGAAISGFKCGHITRSDITDWLVEKTKDETNQQAAILRWAKIAGVASTVAVAVAIIAIFVPLLTSK